MAPGAITAATLAHGARNRWAGFWVAVGHGILEIPLIFVLLFGVGVLLQSSGAKIIIGLAGGAFLIWLSVQSFRDIARPSFDLKNNSGHNTKPLVTGFLLSATNPYFLLWWATGGLMLAQQAHGYGAVTLLLFAAIHWCLDAIWLTILSLGAFGGAHLLSIRKQRYLMGFCAAALLFFGLLFIVRSVRLLIATGASS